MRPAHHKFDARDWPDVGVCFATMDCTFKDLETAFGVPDFVVIHIWWATAVNLYLAPFEFRAQTDVWGSIRGIAAAKAWAEDVGLPLGGIYVEDKAAGPTVVQLLRQNVPGLQPWPRRDKPEERRLAAGSKPSRANAAAAFVRSGNVHLPSPALAPWIDAWLAEVEAFPHGAFDDRVDTLSMACTIAFLDPEASRGRSYWDGLRGL